MNGTRMRTRWLNGAIRLAGVLWLAWDLPFLVLVLPSDFDYYLHAARQLISGENLYYDWMADSVREQIGSWYLYPPYFAACLIPLTWLTRLQARLLFALVCIAAVVGIDFFLTRLRRTVFPKAEVVDPLIHFLVYFTYPTRLVIRSLQVEGILFLLFLWMLDLVMKKRIGWRTGGLFCIGTFVKLWPAPYLLSLGLMGKKRIFVPIAVLSTGIITWYTFRYGWHLQSQYFMDILPRLMSYADTYKDNQSLTLFFFNYFPMNDWMLRLIRWFVLFTYIAATLYNREKLCEGLPQSLLINASLFCCVSLLMTPTAWTAAHLRLLLPIIGTGCFAFEAKYPKTKFPLFFLISLIFYIYPQEMMKKILPVWLDRYPLLYAVVTLYLIFVYLSFCTDSQEK